MNRNSSLRVLILLLATGCARLAGEETSVKPSRAELKEKYIQLWSDVPDYVERWRNGKDPRQPPRVKSALPPQAPPVPLRPAQVVVVRVSLVIAEDGRVEAARVFESADPQFNEAALAAVRQWTFDPALGDAGPMKSFATVPIEFVGPPAPLPINLALAPLGREMRGGVGMRIRIAGPGAAAVRSGCVTISAARDDTGAELQIGGLTHSFRRTAVGSVSPEDFHRVLPPSLHFSLREPAAGATKVTSITGVVELVIPDVDPEATARIEQVASRVDQRLESPALAAAGVTLVLYNHLSPREGPREYDSGPLFGDTPPGMPRQMIGRLTDKLTELDFAFGITDPHGRLVAMEFQQADGSPIEYNHNGWYHSGHTPGKSFSVYRVRSPLPANARLVCWLVTAKSLVKLPLNLTDLPLPQ